MKVKENRWTSGKICENQRKFMKHNRASTELMFRVSPKDHSRSMKSYAVSIRIYFIFMRIYFMDAYLFVSIRIYPYLFVSIRIYSYLISIFRIYFGSKISIRIYSYLFWIAYLFVSILSARMPVKYKQNCDEKKDT